MGELVGAVGRRRFNALKGSWPRVHWQTRLDVRHSPPHNPTGMRRWERTIMRIKYARWV